MDLVKRLFPYRSCTKKITGLRSRAPAWSTTSTVAWRPAPATPSSEDYAKVIDQVIMFMEGDTDSVTRDLEENMALAAETPGVRTGSGPAGPHQGR